MKGLPEDPTIIVCRHETLTRELSLEERTEDIKVLDPNGRVYATIRN